MAHLVDPEIPMVPKLQLALNHEFAVTEFQAAASNDNGRDFVADEFFSCKNRDEVVPSKEER